MITILRKAVFKHGYLFITAAWLYTFSFIVTNYLTYTSSPKKVQQQLSKHIINKEKKVASLVSNTTLLQSLINDADAGEEKINLIKEDFGFFVYTINDIGNPILSYWNNNKYYITPEDLQKQDGYYFVNYQNGDFELIKNTLQVNGKNIVVASLIPIRWHYFMENKYLHAGFNNYEKLDNKYEITTANKGLPIINSNNQTLFKIQKKIEGFELGYDWLTILLRTIAIMLLFFFLNAIAHEIVAKKGFANGFVFLCISIFTIRLLTYFISFPFDYSELSLFDPSIYASNFLHPSLGDLLINTILIFWIIIFFKFNKKINSTLQKKSSYTPYLQLFALCCITLVMASVIRSLVFDSKISFDVSNFFSLTIYSVISFIILCLIILSFFHLSHILLKEVFAKGLPPHIQLLVIAVSGLLLLSFTIGSTAMASNMVVLCWLLLYVVFLNYRKADIELSILKSSFFIFWVMFFAISVAALVINQNRYIELEQRKKWAEKLAQQNDPNSENLLKIATTNFGDTFLSKNYTRLQKEFSNKYIKDSLINQNFSGYLNKYDTRIYTFDNLFHPLHNDDSTSYAVIKTIILNQGKPTSIENLYSYDKPNQKLSYLYEKKILQNNIVNGYLFVVVKPKRYKSEALYPELFRQVQDLSTDFNTNYAYAVYNNAKLISNYNDYSFPSTLTKVSLPIFEFEQRRNNGFSELWYNANNGKRVIIVKKNSWVLELVTLFAYLFCAFLIIIALIHIGGFLVRTRFRRKGFKKLFQFNIRSQIHATIIFISIFSFIIIGIATISFFIYRFNQSNQERLSKSIHVMANQIEEKIKVVKSQLFFDDDLTINDVGFGSDLERKINEVSEIHNVDVNFYNATGSLIASTQPYIYNKHLLSDKMDTKAFYELHHNKNIRFIQSEKVAGFPYLSIYIPVNDGEGKTYAYLNIPYLNSQAELNQEISSFLATLINLNAFIFLIAGAIAFLVTNRITSSFSLISEKMKKINLGKENEIIEWNKNDEIGVLVNEYNIMVSKLGASAKALAQSEREGAWREMARQVAHEIKNPLTPMKLSIQYLQKAINNNSSNVKELSQQVATTLVEQIDQLSKIAGDFSQFANIGNVQLEKFDVSDVIASLVQLYQTQNNVQINWQKEKGIYFIEADKTQISRLFTNLIKNGVEAFEENEIIEITIEQKLVNNQLQISISDKGLGIKPAMQDKIFTPNFTTKSSGTGLGLAMCKGIVEKANGTIWFETEINRGSTFFVSLPLAK